MFKLLFVLFGIGLAVTSGNRHLFYRRDYTYIAEFNAFYKFHWDPTVRSWTDAFKACDDEGAKLFYPKEDLEWTIVNNVTHVNEMNSSEIILGFRDPYGFGVFVNVDGVSVRTLRRIQKEGSMNQGQEGNIGVTLLPTFNSAISGSKPRCIYMDITSGLYNTKDCTSLETIPFVCKKVDESPCPTIDQDYIYNKQVRKCYKVNIRRMTWQEAYQTCFLERAMLLVVEDESEANKIKSIIQDRQTYHVGFYKIGADFFAVTGERLEKIYKKWNEPNPNNYYSNNNSDDEVIISTNDNLDCGAVVIRSETLLTKKVRCHEALPFVCEMTANVVG